MIPRKLSLLVSASTSRLFHGTPALALIKKPLVFATIDNHEFHKVVKHVPPAELELWDPRRSCDLRPLDKVDPNWLKLEFQPFADVIDKLPEFQRKIFTVEFGKRQDGTHIVLDNYLKQTRRHKYDHSSLEFKVTWSTWKIRNIQDLFRTHPEEMRKGQLKISLKELIDKRRKWLNKMRYSDYKRFEWIIEVLGVVFKMQAPWARIERKTALNVLVNMYCNELRDQKMTEYKDQLEKEKLPFLQSKLDTLTKIRKDEISVGCESSVDEEIVATRKLLRVLEKCHMTIHPAMMTSESSFGVNATS